MTKILVLAAIVGGIIALAVLYLYQKRKLREDHALLWLFVSISIIVISMWTDFLLVLAFILDTPNIADVILAAFIAFLLVICIYYSTKISELSTSIKLLTQEIAILKAKPEEQSIEKARNNSK